MAHKPLDSWQIQPSEGMLVRCADGTTSYHSPSFQRLLLIVQGHEPIYVQAFFPKASDERFDIGAIGWRAGYREHQRDLSVIGPGI